jgi:FkbM family methyltransferase
MSMGEPRISGAEPFAASQGEMRHHNVFSRFKCWEGIAPAGFWVNFLGVRISTTFQSTSHTGHQPPSRDRYLKTEYPPFQERPPQLSGGEIEWTEIPEEYFEWVDLLEATAGAREHFIMIELGAGWGRWIANAAAALRQANPLPYTLIAVEAEPTHFNWMTEHMKNNYVDPSCCHLIEAAVADKEGTVGFHTGSTPWGGPADWYGQAIGGPTPVKSVTLQPILASVTRPIDLLDLDVQGAELMVLLAAAEAVNEKVRRVHIGTHSQEIETGLRRLFHGFAWHNFYDFPAQSQSETPWGRIKFEDGVQTWINPRFFDPAAPAG